MKLHEETERLNLKRYGFIPAPEENFRDDGNSFKGYYYDPKRTNDKRFRTSKLVSNGEVYISVRYYNEETNNYTYFDDLNGVDYTYAINHLPDLVKEIEAFKTKLDAGEIKAKVLSDDEFKDIKEKIKQIMDLTGENRFYATQKVFSRLGIDLKDLNYNQKNQLDKEIESEVRNARNDDAEVVKALAKDYLDEVMKLMKGTEGHHGPRNKWIPAKEPISLDKALQQAWVYKKIGNDWYGLTDLTDANQEKIKTWVENKLKNFYDFE